MAVEIGDILGQIGSGTYKLLDCVDIDWGSLSGLLKVDTNVLSVITDNSSNWNTAYGWGNHASAGYALAANVIPYSGATADVDLGTHTLSSVGYIQTEDAGGFYGVGTHLTALDGANIKDGTYGSITVSSGAWSWASPMTGPIATTYTPAGNTLTHASIYLNAVSAPANSYLFALGVSNAEKYHLDAEGDSVQTGSHTALQFVSTIASGEGNQPYACTSTVLNTNLNADMVDGHHSTSFLLATGATTGATSQAQQFDIGLILGIDAATNTAGTMKLFSAGTNNYYSTFTAGTQTANADYTLPTAMPASNKFLQSTNAGVLSWETVATTETDPVVAAINGIVKSNGSTISAAAAGTDYDNYWSISGTTISPRTAGNAILTTGHAGFGSDSSIVGANTLTLADTGSGVGVYGINETVYAIKGDGTTVGAYGLLFAINYKPNSTGTQRHVTTLAGSYGGTKISVYDSTTVNHYATNAYNYLASTSVTGIAGNSIPYITTLYNFYAAAPNLSNGTITNDYGFYAAAQGGGTLNTAFYDAGQTSATTNWGLAINTANNYINGSLRIGSAVAPTVPLDVTGAITSSAIVTGTFFQVSTAPTANSSGTVAIVAKNADLLTANAGWLPLKRSDGTTVFVPYWT